MFKYKGDLFILKSLTTDCHVEFFFALNYLVFNVLLDWNTKQY